MVGEVQRWSRSSGPCLSIIVCFNFNIYEGVFKGCSYSSPAGGMLFGVSGLLLLLLLFKGCSALRLSQPWRACHLPTLLSGRSTMAPSPSSLRTAAASAATTAGIPCKQRVRKGTGGRTGRSRAGSMQPARCSGPSKSQFSRPTTWT